jgi:hypothetical protein
MRDKVQPLIPSKDAGEALARYDEIAHKRKSFVPGTSPFLCPAGSMVPKRCVV